MCIMQHTFNSIEKFVKDLMKVKEFYDMEKNSNIMVTTPVLKGINK